jgi:hypothetical protein
MDIDVQNIGNLSEEQESMLDELLLLQGARCMYEALTACADHTPREFVTELAP